MSGKQAKGKIVSWNQAKGFGFIMPNDGGHRIFVHITTFLNRKELPKVNHLVSYSVATDKQGRPCASRVSRVGAKSVKINKSSSLIICAVTFLIIVGLSVLMGMLTPLALPLYLGLSLLLFIIYAMDKSAARNGSWRTSENTLHLLAIAGGWPGAVIAQQILHHKSKKQPFRLVFWITIVINIGLFVGLHIPNMGNRLVTLINNVL